MWPNSCTLHHKTPALAHLSFQRVRLQGDLLTFRSHPAKDKLLLRFQAADLDSLSFDLDAPESRLKLLF